jgi:hypothetical protein
LDRMKIRLTSSLATRFGLTILTWRRQGRPTFKPAPARGRPRFGPRFGKFRVL